MGQLPHLPHRFRRPCKHIEKDKPDITFNKEHKQDIKMIRTKPDMTDEITYQEEKGALILGIAAVFTVWWMFK